MPENKNLSGLQELHMHNGILQQGLMEFYQFVKLPRGLRILKFGQHSPGISSMYNSLLQQQPGSDVSFSVSGRLPLSLCGSSAWGTKAFSPLTELLDLTKERGRKEGRHSVVPVQCHTLGFRGKLARPFLVAAVVDSIGFLTGTAAEKLLPQRHYSHLNVLFLYLKMVETAGTTRTRVSCCPSIILIIIIIPASCLRTHQRLLIMTSLPGLL